MQIPIYEGCYVDGNADFRSSYPINLAPTPKKTGLSDGYLRTVEGVALFGAAASMPGRDRGGIAWNGTTYRASGSKLVSVDVNGIVTVIGDIGDNGRDAFFTFSFDRLGIASNGILWYYQTSTGLLTSVVDPDIGFVNAVLWVDGYFVVTDGITIAVTELSDPYAVNPLKYGTAEESPDVINCFVHISGQLVAVGQLTCEFFQNIGGNLFPFQRLPNALIERGSAGLYCAALYNQTFAFVGQGINEAPAVYMATPGGTAKISTREIDIELLAVTTAQFRDMKVESRVDKHAQLLYVHLPTKTAVYDVTATTLFGQPIWYYLNSGTDGALPYRARNFVRCYDKWLCGDLQAFQNGQLITNATTQYGTRCAWQFDTTFGFNQGLGAIFHQIELMHKPGAAGSKAVIWHQYSDDGQTFSMPRQAMPTTPGQSMVRATWFACGLMRSARVLRFRGVNDTPDSFAALVANVEPLTA